MATQNEDLRQLFNGRAHHVVNFMHFIAQELREVLAELGLRSVEELIGRTDLLEANHSVANEKARSLDVAPLLYQNEGP
ncbi:glutamate synthase-related protein, partial [Klebsiella pneumoniae]|nr:glutamate synthase-related protein [Klebsiella pneumoniae]